MRESGERLTDKIFGEMRIYCCPDYYHIIDLLSYLILISDVRSGCCIIEMMDSMASETPFQGKKWFPGDIRSWLNVVDAK
jgi:hypothetical protein